MPDFIAIIGAGLTGLMAALHLAQRGLSVVVFEKRPLSEIIAKRYTTSGRAGRSMSMDISARGIFALKEVGVFSNIQKRSIPMNYRVFHEPNGKQFSLHYGQYEHENILTVSRLHLFTTLLEKCQSISNIEVMFEHPLVDINFNERTVTLFSLDENYHKVLSPLIVIGADGVNSLVRSCIDARGELFETTTFPLSYKELTIPSHLTQELSINAMHKWARRNAMLVAQPNQDQSFTCALLLPEDKTPHSFSAFNSAHAIRKFFNEQFQDISHRMPELENEYIANPVCRMKIVKGSRWTKDNFVLLLGDAAHSMVPFFGQGVNCCFEDCTFLGLCIDALSTNWEAIFAEFDSARVSEANAINQMSYENYPELFFFDDIEIIQHRRRIEAELMKRYRSFRSYHNLVCFERVPYTLAQQVKIVQTKLLNQICRNVKVDEHIDPTFLAKEFAIYQEEIATLFADKTYET